MSDEARQMAEMELAAGLPHSQEAGCRLAARVAIQRLGVPSTDDDYAAAAIGGARGLFGEAFEAADEDQRDTWVAMYERALRDEAAKHVEN